MGNQPNKSVLIIDDKPSFSIPLASLLQREGYQTKVASTVEEAADGLTGDWRPTFILADRKLQEGVIDAKLTTLAGSSPGPLVVIYTTASDLSDEDKYRIIKAGAVRVIDRKVADVMVPDIKGLTDELDELIDLKAEMQRTTTERSRMVAALLGTDVAVTIIDENFYCWFANSVQDRFAGRPSAGGLCWTLFHEHAPECGPCWGCTVADVRKGRETVIRLFLSRYSNGNLRWVSVKASPIRLDPNKDDSKIIAVTEGVTEVSEAYVHGLPRDQRLLKIAQGLIHVGFGQARIYQVHNAKSTLVAAASHADDAAAPQSAYAAALGSPSLPNHEKCPYVRQAMRARTGLLVRDWSTDGRSPLANTVDLVPPYFIVPVWSSGNALSGYIEVDFEFPPRRAAQRQASLERYLNDNTLQWLQGGYAAEVRKAFESDAPQDAQDCHYEIVNRTKLGIGAARSLEDAIHSLHSAFQAIVPECLLSVRVLGGDNMDELLECRDLCRGPRGPHTPASIRCNDPQSLAADVVGAGRPWWIDDLPGFRKQMQERHPPVAYGYSLEDVRSAAHIPLRVESAIVGSLSLDSRTPVKWSEDFKNTLLSLAGLVALVLRDVTLYRAMADKAAILASSLVMSTGFMWRHQALQRLTEAGFIINRARTALDANRLDQVRGRLHDLEQDINLILQGPEPIDKRRRCSLGQVIALLQKTCSAKGIKFIFPDPRGLPEVKAPCFAVRDVLKNLLDNAIRAIQRSRKGDEVRVTVDQQDNMIMITVEDNGPGVPPEVRPRLLREKLDDHPDHGTGLLAGRGIALQNGGDLRYEPLDPGSRFTLRLPTA